MRKTATIVGTVLAAVGIAGVAVAATTGDERERAGKATRPALTERAVTRTVEPGIRTHLRIFRVAKASDALPQEIRDMIDRDLAPRSGANWRFARTVETATGPFYVVPGDGTICQIGNGGGACGDASRLGEDARDYVLMTYTRENPKGTITVSGLATDDVKSVEAVQPDGTRIDVPIRASVYSSFVPQRTIGLAYTTSDGKEVIKDVSTPAAPDSSAREGTLVDSR